MLAFDHIESADARADKNTRALRDVGTHLQFRHFHREVRGRQGQLDKPAHLLQFFFLDPRQRIEILHFPGNAAVEARGIKLRNRPDARLPAGNILPGLFGADTAPANQPHTGDHHTTFQRGFSIWRE